MAGWTTNDLLQMVQPPPQAAAPPPPAQGAGGQTYMPTIDVGGSGYDPNAAPGQFGSESAAVPSGTGIPGKPLDVPPLPPMQGIGQPPAPAQQPAPQPAQTPERSGGSASSGSGWTTDDLLKMVPQAPAQQPPPAAAPSQAPVIAPQMLPQQQPQQPETRETQNAVPAPAQQPPSGPGGGNGILDTAQQFWAKFGEPAAAAVTAAPRGAFGRAGDYAVAAMETPARAAINGTGVVPAFQQALASQAWLQQQHPIASGIGNAAGALGSVIPIAPMLAFNAPAAAGLMPRLAAAGSYLARNAGLGAGEAALHGDNPLQGAGTAAAISAAAPAVGAVGRVAFAPIQSVARMASPALQESSVAQNLARTTGVQPGQIVSSPVGPLDLAQATGNPAVAGKVDYAAGKIAAGQAALLREQQAQAMRDWLSGHGIQPQAPAQASAGLVNAVRNSREAVGQQESQLWNAAPLKQHQIQTAWVKGTVQQAVRQLDPGLQLGVSGSIRAALDHLDNMPAQAPVADLNSVRTALRLAGRPSESNPWAGPVAARLQDAFMQGLDRTLASSRVPPDVRQAYDTARTFTRQRVQAFGTQPLQGILRENAAGIPVRNASTGAGSFFGFNAGAGEGPKSLADLSNFVAGLKHPGAQQLSAQILDNARSYIGTALLSAARVGVQEGGRINANQMVRFLDTNRNWIEKSGVFTQQQVEALRKLLDYGKLLQRGDAAIAQGNSATMRRADQAKDFIDEVMGGGTKAAMRVVSLFGGMHAAGPIGGLLGHGASHAADTVAESANDRMRELMSAVLFDPQVARDLLMRANRQNALFISPITRRLLLSVRPTIEKEASQ